MNELNESMYEMNDILGSLTGSNVSSLDPVLLLLIVGIGLIVVLFVFLFRIIGMWKLFNKAGIGGWRVLIPFYGSFVYVVNICKCSWVVYLMRLFLFWVFPINVIINAIICYNLAIKTHQSPTSYVWFSILNIPVEVILGFCRNSYEYNASEASSGFGFFGKKQ